MVQVFVENFRNPGVYSTYDLTPSKQSVWDLKKAIEDSDGIPTSTQHLEIKGVPLTNGTLLATYSIPEGALISLLQPPTYELDIRHTPHNPHYDRRSAIPGRFYGEHERTSLPSTPSGHGIPLRSFPKPPPTEFMVKIADGGHTFVCVSLGIDKSCSGPTTRVRVKLVSKAFSSRRISAISLHITVPNAEVVDVFPKELIDSQKEMTNYSVQTEVSSSVGLRSIGVTLPAGPGIEIGVGGKRERNRKEVQSGKKYSAKTMLGNIVQNNMVYWQVKEAEIGGGGGKGLDGEQGEMWFNLRGKPIDFEYDCRITHVGKDRKEKIKQAMSKSWFERCFG